MFGFFIVVSILYAVVCLPLMVMIKQTIEMYYQSSSRVWYSRYMQGGWGAEYVKGKIVQSYSDQDCYDKFIEYNDKYCNSSAIWFRIAKIMVPAVLILSGITTVIVFGILEF